MAAKIKLQYDSLTEVPTGFAELYEERNGKAVLVGVEEMSLALKTVAEKERAARGEIEKKLKRFERLGDKDPEELLKIADEVEDLRAQLEVSGGGKGDEAVQKRIESAVARATNAMKRDVDKYKAEAETHRTTAEGLAKTIRSTRLQDALTQAALKAKVRPEAHEDILRYQDVFELGDDGKIATRDSVGATPGLDPTLWLEDMKSKRPHWWANSIGAGASGANGGGAPSGNPFAKDAPNVTLAGRLMSTDPAKALQYAKAAGYADPKAAIAAMAKASLGKVG